jgi:hypothetical protein
MDLRDMNLSINYTEFLNKEIIKSIRPLKKLMHSTTYRYSLYCTSNWKSMSRLLSNNNLEVHMGSMRMDQTYSHISTQNNQSHKHNWNRIGSVVTCKCQYSNTGSARRSLWLGCNSYQCNHKDNLKTKLVKFWVHRRSDRYKAKFTRKKFDWPWNKVIINYYKSGTANKIPISRYSRLRCNTWLHWGKSSMCKYLWSHRNKCLCIPVRIGSLNGQIWKIRSLRKLARMETL